MRANLTPGQIQISKGSDESCCNLYKIQQVLTFKTLLSYFNISRRTLTSKFLSYVSQTNQAY